jgi:hypothetical protein
MLSLLRKVKNLPPKLQNTKFHRSNYSDIQPFVIFGALVF